MGSTLLQSMPAELTAGVAARQVKPDRERIRSILNMGSVIELQLAIEREHLLVGQSPWDDI